MTLLPSTELPKETKKKDVDFDFNENFPSFADTMIKTTERGKWLMKKVKEKTGQSITSVLAERLAKQSEAQIFAYFKTLVDPVTAKSISTQFTRIFGKSTNHIN